MPTVAAVTSGTFANVSIGTTDTATTSVAVVQCTGWTLQRTGTDGAYASNATNGNRRRVIGTKDATGNITGVYDPALPIEAVMAVGDRVHLRLHTTATKGHKLYARITSGPDYGGDVKDGNPAEWTCGWAQDDNSPTFNTTLNAPTDPYA